MTRKREGRLHTQVKSPAAVRDGARAGCIIKEASERTQFILIPQQALPMDVEAVRVLTACRTRCHSL